jgi:nicotinamide riboside kinase
MRKGKAKSVYIVGPPCSGKSTLASDVHTKLKKEGHNSVFVSEAATDYIAEYGVPDAPYDQIVIFYKQLNREKMFMDTKDFIICDSSTILNYFYFRRLFSHVLSQKDIAAINHMQKEILKNSQHWTHIFFVPPIDAEAEDGIRFHKKEEIETLGQLIKAYLEIENIPYVDLSEVPINERGDFVTKKILNKED